MDIIGLTAVVMIFGIPITAIITGYMKSIAQMRLEAATKAGNSDTNTAIAALREEVARLRDTTTQYDIAFDTALQRLDSRVERLETQAASTMHTVVEPAAAEMINTRE